MSRAVLVMLSFLTLLVGIAFIVAAHPSVVASVAVLLVACVMLGVSWFKG